MENYSEPNRTGCMENYSEPNRTGCMVNYSEPNRTSCMKNYSEPNGTSCLEKTKDISEILTRPPLPLSSEKKVFIKKRTII